MFELVAYTMATISFSIGTSLKQLNNHSKPFVKSNSFFWDSSIFLAGGHRDLRPLNRHVMSSRSFSTFCSSVSVSEKVHSASIADLPNGNWNCQLLGFFGKRREKSRNEQKVNFFTSGILLLNLII